MIELSQEQIAKAREMESNLSQRISESGQLPIARTLGVDKDAFNRFYGNKNGIGIKQTSELLALLGLELHPVGTLTCPPGSAPIPNEMSVTALIMIRQAYGNGAQVRYLEYALDRKGAIKRDVEGNIIIPKNMFNGDV